MEKEKAIEIFNRQINCYKTDREECVSIASCSHCKHNVTPEELTEAIQMAISALEKQEADRWHSVAKEGNPPKIGYYLWSARGGNVDIDFYDGEKWGKASKYLYEVLAWKYRPEPYTEEEA